jgi:hypothetical protein
MSRSLVSADELLEILTRGLQARKEGAGCVVLGPIRRLDTPRPDGGNWDRSLAIRGGPVDPYAAGEAMHDVVDEVGDRYNLCEEAPPGADSGASDA